MRMENRSFTISSGVPAFLAKLWKLVDDPSSDHLISWSSVIIHNAHLQHNVNYCTACCSVGIRSHLDIQIKANK